MENLVFDQVFEFRQVHADLRHVFNQLSTFFVQNLVANLLRTCCINIESISRDWCSRFAAGSLVRARARQMECRKNRFEPANELDEFSLLILLFLECTDVHREILHSYHWLPVPEAECSTHHICVRFFLAANIVAASKLQTTSAALKQRLCRLRPPYCERYVRFLAHDIHVTAEITRF